MSPAVEFHSFNSGFRLIQIGILPYPPTLHPPEEPTNPLFMLIQWPPQNIATTLSLSLNHYKKSKGSMVNGEQSFSSNFRSSFSSFLKLSSFFNSLVPCSTLATTILCFLLSENQSSSSAVVVAVAFHAMNTQPEQVCYQPPKMYTIGVWLGDNPLNYPLPLLTLQLFLVFTTTRFFCYILRPLKQPRVVSEILVSVTIHPSIYYISSSLLLCYDIIHFRHIFGSAFTAEAGHS